MSTTTASLARPRSTDAPLDAQVRDGVRTLWDNSNIVESYSGITTPLTFSFARGAYEQVYREFCRLLGVPDRVLRQHDAVFRNMLGLIRGRVYYNLFNWYRALALLPGFRMNRRFMEQMMGVTEGLPDTVAAELGALSWTSRVGDGFRLLTTTGRLVAAHLTLARRKRRFLDRLDRALGAQRPDFSTVRLEDLATYYRRLERELLAHWDAPLVNDFLAMIASGLLRKSLARWCDDDFGSLHNDLLCGAGDALCAEPAARIASMAEQARRSPRLVPALAEGSLPAVVAAAADAPGFRAALEAYLAKFGDRCVEELKLESRTLHDDPRVLLHSIARLAASDARQAAPLTATDRRAAAEHYLAKALRRRPLRRAALAWMLRTARARVRDRENLRLERTRVFARAREIFLAAGRRLTEIDQLDDPREVFYLEVDELWGFVEGRGAGADLRGLVAVRKQEFAGYATGEPPPRRFETIGPVQASPLYPCAMGTPPADDAQRQGLGGSPGVVRGRVRVVHDPHSTEFAAGEILVAERTDPGWIVLYSAAAALLIERGSLLSHSMIVARELGIPAVAALPQVTSWLKDGDWVEVDGARGLVTRISTPPG